MPQKRACFDIFDRNQLKPISRVFIQRASLSGWIGMTNNSESQITAAKVKELQTQVDDLKELVNTLLSIICEEPDGVTSGAAPSYGQPKMNYCM